MGLAGLTDVEGDVEGMGIVLAGIFVAPIADGLVTASLVVVEVWATAKPMVPTMPSAVAEVIKNFDLFIVKLRWGCVAEPST